MVINIDNQNSKEILFHFNKREAYGEYLKFPKVNTFLLSNGLKVYHSEITNYPLTYFSLVTNAGLFEDSIQIPGLGHFTNRLLLKSTKETNSMAKKLIDLNRVEFTGTTLKDGVTIVGCSFKEYFFDAMTILLDIYKNPNIKVRDVINLKSSTTEMISKNLQLPYYQAFALLYRKLFGANNLYGYLDNGTLNSIKKITYKSVVNHINNYYQPDNIALIVLGDVRLSEIEKYVCDKLSDWNGNAQIPSVYNRIQQNEDQIMVINLPSNKISVLLGKHVCYQSVNDMLKLLLLKYFLNVKLNKILCKKHGLVSNILADIIFRKHTGVLFIRFFAQIENIRKITIIINDIINELQSKKISKYELLLAKKDVYIQIIKGTYNHELILNNITRLFVYKLPDDYHQTIFSNLEDINNDDLKNTLSNNLNLQEFKTIMVGSIEEISKKIVCTEIGVNDLL